MKILHVNISDLHGGAARAAYRLHQGLLSAGIESRMLVVSKKSDDRTAIGPANSVQYIQDRIRYLLDGFPLKWYGNRKRELFSPAWAGFSSMANRINKLNPDIVHLHWINGGMLNIGEIAKIHAPIVWSLHDMWAFTGGCHYSDGCERYKNNCGNCKVLGSDSSKDLSRKIFEKKRKAYSKKEMTIVGLSRWLNRCAEESTLLRDKKHINLPNPIDTDIYKPFAKDAARALWNLPQDKKLVLFGAINATADPRKGFHELNEALHKMSDDTTELVVFGSSEPKVSQNFGLTTHYLGHIRDDVSLVTLYNAVDVMVVPSLQENLSNAIMEALACGTPVVGFDIGGNSDMVEHQINGYLARSFDTGDLKMGIEWVLNHSKYDDLRRRAREKVVKTFESRAVAEQYLMLYREILGES